MCVQRALPRSYLLLGFAVSTVMTFGSTFEAQAQADFNIQSRLNTFTTPLVLSPDIATPSATPSDPTAAVFSSFSKGARNAAAPKGGACIKDKDFVLLILEKLSTEGKLRYMPEDLQDLKSGKDPRLAKPEDAARILNHILSRLNDSQDGAILQWLKDPQPPKGSKKSQDVGVALPVLPVSFCDYSPPPTVKVSSPFNPSLESNVLKSNTNVQADRALGYGGTAQVTAAGFRPYDVMGLSIGSASARYDKFPSKSVDQLVTQGAYQFFINARGYINYNYKDMKDGVPIDVDPKAPPETMPATNLITVSTIALGFIDQKAYTPPFQSETVELFTPQVTFARQNISLLGGDIRNVCAVELPDFRKSGFCYYADLSLTVGQTFSDLPTQENVNISASATLGKRFDQSDWKLTVQTVVTERVYEHVVGGRRDVLLQVGSTLTYAPPALASSLGKGTVTFSLPATYNQNYSTLAKAEWHGVVVMPTLTLAFTPAAPAK